MAMSEEPVLRDELPPPQTMTLDSSVRDLLLASYTVSDELLANAPEFFRMYGDRWSIRWTDSGVAEPAAQSTVDISITVRPVAPATIIIKV